MGNYILVTKYVDYGAALTGLGEMTANVTKFVNQVDDFKLVLFTGGEDVSPTLYNETSPDKLCQSNMQRDSLEIMIFKHALMYDIPMAGICRGLQFLNVMAGGRLVHHLSNHNGEHHDFGCQKDDKIRRVNSIHHQMVIPPKDAFIVGWSVDKLSDKYIGDKDEPTQWPGPEVEAAIYPKINACGVQYHPEMMDPDTEGYTFFYNMVAHLLDYSKEMFIKIYTGKVEAANVV